MPVDTDQIYAEVNARVLAALAKGVAPWTKPWGSGTGLGSQPRNLQSGKAYRGINAFLLSPFVSGYQDPRWTTANAALKVGAKIPKGSKTTLVTLWKRLRVQDKDNPGQTKVIAILRYFRVFNATQLIWPEGKLPALVETKKPEGFNAIAEAEAVMDTFLSYPNAPELDEHTGVGGACYMPLLHKVQVPLREEFHQNSGFYNTLFHEFAHSTGHGSMLDRRDAFGNGFGTDKYAREELVAEMTAAMVCAVIGIDAEFDNSTAYIKNWMSRIEDEPKLLVQAAGRAQKAADLILGVSFSDEPTEAKSKEIVA